MSCKAEVTYPTFTSITPQFYVKNDLLKLETMIAIVTDNLGITVFMCTDFNPQIYCYRPIPMRTQFADVNFKAAIQPSTAKSSAAWPQHTSPSLASLQH